MKQKRDRRAVPEGGAGCGEVYGVAPCPVRTGVGKAGRALRGGVERRRLRRTLGGKIGDEVGGVFSVGWCDAGESATKVGGGKLNGVGLWGWVPCPGSELCCGVWEEWAIGLLTNWTVGECV